MSVAWSYSKWFMSIVRSTFLLVDHSVVKVWILALVYKSTPTFVEIFFRLKFITYIYIYIYIYLSCNLFMLGTSKLGTVVKGNLKAPLSIATTPRYRGERCSIPELLHFTLDLYLIVLSAKQGSIK